MNLNLSHCTWSEYTSDGFLAVQIDSFGANGRGMSPFHHLSPLGLDARPVDPEGEVGALAWRMFDAKEGFGFPLNDVRTEAALPNLNKGATRIFDTGTFKDKPFHFTCTLDPVTQHCTIESHRPGGKIILRNEEGVKVEIAATEVKIRGASAVEAGGTLALAKFEELKSVLDDISSALEKLAGNAYNAAAVPAITNAVARIAAFAASGGTVITKGG